MEAVSDILAERTRPPRGMNRTVAVSALAHVVLLTAFFLMPTLPERRETEREVMQISLGGAPGPQAGGMTPMGVRCRPHLWKRWLGARPSRRPRRGHRR